MPGARREIKPHSQPSAACRREQDGPRPTARAARRLKPCPTSEPLPRLPLLGTTRAWAAPCPAAAATTITTPRPAASRTASERHQRQTRALQRRRRKRRRPVHPTAGAPGSSHRPHLSAAGDSSSRGGQRWSRRRLPGIAAAAAAAAAACTSLPPPGILAPSLSDILLLCSCVRADAAPAASLTLDRDVPSTPVPTVETSKARHPGAPRPLRGHCTTPCSTAVPAVLHGAFSSAHAAAAAWPCRGRMCAPKVSGALGRSLHLAVLGSAAAPAGPLPTLGPLAFEMPPRPRNNFCTSSSPRRARAGPATGGQLGWWPSCPQSSVPWPTFFFPSCTALPVAPPKGPCCPRTPAARRPIANPQTPASWRRPPCASQQHVRRAHRLSCGARAVPRARGCVERPAASGAGPSIPCAYGPLARSRREARRLPRGLRGGSHERAGALPAAAAPPAAAHASLPPARRRQRAGGAPRAACAPLPGALGCSPHGAGGGAPQGTSPCAAGLHACPVQCNTHGTISSRSLAVGSPAAFI
jgi:hypothetical protein